MNPGNTYDSGGVPLLIQIIQTQLQAEIING
jgi:hypothetical protein